MEAAIWVAVGVVASLWLFALLFVTSAFFVAGRYDESVRRSEDAARKAAHPRVSTGETLLYGRQVDRHVVLPIKSYRHLKARETRNL